MVGKAVSMRYAELMSLVALVKHHRDHCNEEDCNVSLFPLQAVAKELAMRCRGDEFDDALKLVNKTEWL